MWPVFFYIGPLVIEFYYIFLAIGMFTGLLGTLTMGARRVKPWPIEPLMLVYLMIGGLVGARAFWVIEYQGVRPLHTALLIWRGGLAFYGGLCGGLLATSLYFRMKQVPVLEGWDILAPFVALGEAITRIGCLLNGCCWGRPTRLPWGIRFPRASYGAYLQHLEHGFIEPAARWSLPVHPTQLYSTLALLIVFFLCLYTYNRRRFTGEVFLVYLIFSCASRFAIEYLRADSARIFLNLTLYHLLSAAVVIGAGAVLMARLCVSRRDQSQV